MELILTKNLIEWACSEKGLVIFSLPLVSDHESELNRINSLKENGSTAEKLWKRINPFSKISTPPWKVPFHTNLNPS